MNKKPIRLFSLVLAAVVLAACSPAAPVQESASITLTLENGACAYAGPQIIPAGSEISAQWVVKDTDQPAYTVGAFYLVPGKTLEDVRSGIAGSGATVGVMESYGSAEVAAGGGSKEFQVRTSKSPLYFLCVADPLSEKFQILGPYEVQGG